jgi:hypothetical protein
LIPLGLNHKCLDPIYPEPFNCTRLNLHFTRTCHVKHKLTLPFLVLDDTYIIFTPLVQLWMCVSKLTIHAFFVHYCSLCETLDLQGSGPTDPGTFVYININLHITMMLHEQILQNFYCWFLKSLKINIIFPILPPLQLWTSFVQIRISLLKDNPYQVWFHSVEQFCRRRLKCAKVIHRCQTSSNTKSS